MGPGSIAKVQVYTWTVSQAHACTLPSNPFPASCEHSGWLPMAGDAGNMHMHKAPDLVSIELEKSLRARGRMCVAATSKHKISTHSSSRFNGFILLLLLHIITASVIISL